MKKKDEIKVCLVGSSGGHLTHLYMLKPFWKDKNRFWVTFDKEDARSLLEGEKVLIGNIDQFIGKVNEILFVVYSFLFSLLFSVLKIGFVRFIHDAVHILRGQFSAGK